jgi:hypothetical protein
MGPPGSRLFRRSIGYGVYGQDEDAEGITISIMPIIPILPVPAEALNHPSKEPSDKILGVIDRKTFVYMLGALVIYKILF